MARRRIDPAFEKRVRRFVDDLLRVFERHQLGHGLSGVRFTHEKGAKRTRVSITTRRRARRPRSAT